MLKTINAICNQLKVPLTATSPSGSDALSNLIGWDMRLPQEEVLQQFLSSCCCALHELDMGKSVRHLFITRNVRWISATPNPIWLLIWFGRDAGNCTPKQRGNVALPPPPTQRIWPGRVASVSCLASINKRSGRSAQLPAWGCV